MKKIKFAVRLLIVSMLFWVCYNTYFGWNLKPINDIEESCDTIFSVLRFFGLVIFFSPLLDVYVDFIKDYESKKNRV